MRDMKHERRSAKNRGVDEGGRDPQIFCQRQTGGAALRRPAQQPVDVAQSETAIGQCPLNALRHQVDRAHLLGDGAEIGFGDADDCGGAALQPVHYAVSPTELVRGLSTHGTKTG